MGCGMFLVADRSSVHAGRIVLAPGNRLGKEEPMARWRIFIVTHPLPDAGFVTKGVRTMKGHLVRSLVTGAASLVLLTVAVSPSRAGIAATLTITPTVGPPTTLVDGAGSG